MKNSPLPINGKKLASRWDIKTVDLLYVMLNHGLHVVNEFHNEVDMGDILADFKENKDASDYMFSLSEVKEIENKLKVDGEIPHAATIRGNDLMARWDMHQAEIFLIMINSGLEAIDPFGHELDSKHIFSLLRDNTLDASDLLFRLSDVEEFESDHPEIVSDPNQAKKPQKTLRPNQLHKIKCREVAQKLWDEDPTITIIDMTYKDELNDLFDGKSYVDKTIRNWIKDLCPNRSPGRRSKKK